MPFAKHDDPRQAFLLDGADEPLRIGVQVRAPRRKPHRSYTCPLEDLIEGTGEERITVMDQVAGIPQEAIEGVGEVPCYLLHPELVLFFWTPLVLNFGLVLFGFELLGRDTAEG